MTGIQRGDRATFDVLEALPHSSAVKGGASLIAQLAVTRVAGVTVRRWYVPGETGAYPSQVVADWDAVVLWVADEPGEVEMTEEPFVECGFLLGLSSLFCKRRAGHDGPHRDGTVEWRITYYAGSEQGE